MGVLARLAGRLAIAAVFGAWTALCTVALAPRTWGLALGLVASAAAVAVLRRGAWRLGFCVGWAAVIGLALPARPEGDLVISADAHGWTLLGAALAAVVVGVATLPAPARGRRRAPPPT